MEAKRDQNNVPTILGVLNTNGETVMAVQANPATKSLAVNNNTTGTDNGPDHALRDENFVPTMLAISDADGETLVPLYVDADGKLLIDET
jgi:hypothetical protein